ncbi:prolipoprotein diacylglyceryl transferase [Kribbella catacumbae]|uniref:prolipoprotein diacylglyceryl transferase n=1 Tax=Kribbella catacumbae TaxID=460086 RepID=UPI00036696D7|nr:prolipoprotein diacylglyceryl transferase [Kribbella catacumbae]
MSSLLPAVIVPAFIPSPSQGVWHLGPLPLRAYAICILLGIFAGYWLGRRRWVARGGSAEVLADVIMWAVPFGLVGARIYHVITDAELYFGEGKHPIDALKIWHGGLGIWGAVAFGALGAWIACRRHKVPFLAVADAMAPGIALAQVIGRFGNYFNQELFGKPTNHWWGLEIDPAHRPDGFQDFGTFHPTFLYEAIWNLGVIALVIVLGRRFKLGHGRAFAVYVAGYTAGRAWIENLRIDTVNEFAGLRLNVWTSIILFILAVAFFILSARLKPGQEDISTAPADTTPADTTPADTTPSDAAAADTPDTAATEEPEAGAADERPATAADTSTEGEPVAKPTDASPADTKPGDSRASGAGETKTDLRLDSTDGSRD